MELNELHTSVESQVVGNVGAVVAHNRWMEAEPTRRAAAFEYAQKFRVQTGDSPADIEARIEMLIDEARIASGQRRAEDVVGALGAMRAGATAILSDATADEDGDVTLRGGKGARLIAASAEKLGHHFARFFRHRTELMR